MNNQWDYPDNKDIFGGGCYEALVSVGREQELNCCPSCHEDYEQGYSSLTEIAKDGKWYKVCCAVSNILMPYE